jgi:hypothetical protein
MIGRDGPEVELPDLSQLGPSGSACSLQAPQGPSRQGGVVALYMVLELGEWVASGRAFGTAHKRHFE